MNKNKISLSLLLASVSLAFFSTESHAVRIKRDENGNVIERKITPNKVEEKVLEVAEIKKTLVGSWTNGTDHNPHKPKNIGFDAIYISVKNSSKNYEYYVAAKQGDFKYFNGSPIIYSFTKEGGASVIKSSSEFYTITTPSSKDLQRLIQHSFEKTTGISGSPLIYKVDKNNFKSPIKIDVKNINKFKREKNRIENQMKKFFK